MPKFSSKRSEVLYYGQEPNDQVGSSSDGLGWAGLYLIPGSAVILFENTNGVVHEYEYVDEDEVRESWRNFEISLDRRSPERGDYVISLSKITGSWLIEKFGMENSTIASNLFYNFWEALGWLKCYMFLLELEGEVWKFDGANFLLWEVNAERSQE